MNGAIDLGTSRIKIFSSGRPPLVAARTPDRPDQIVDALFRLRDEHLPDAETVAISCFRRATVVDDGDGLRVSWAREALTHPADPAAPWDRLAPAAKWAAAPSCRTVVGRLALLEAWLSLRLTGRCAIGRTTAALTGLWDHGNATWSEELLARFCLEPDALPEVLSGPVESGGWMLPILGDHQATCAIASQLEGCIGVLEIGTALALVSWRSRPGPWWRHAWGVPSQDHAELIDAQHSRRRAGESLPAPPWLSTEQYPSPVAVAIQSLRVSGVGSRSGWLAASGGGLTSSLFCAVQGAVPIRVMHAPLAIPAVGATLVVATDEERSRIMAEALATRVPVGEFIGA